MSDHDFYAGISEVEDNIDNPDITDEWLEGLPKPRLWRILVMPAVPEKVSQGGILLTDGAVETQKHLTYLGRVLALGPLAFKDKRLEGEEPPKQGDYVAFGKYAGQAMIYKGTKLLLLNDDELLASVPDPSLLKVHF